MSVTVVLLVLAVVAWLAYEARPLAAGEVHALAAKRRLSAVMRSYGFDRSASQASPDAKRRMNSKGKLYRVDIPVQQFPATMAALLKGKKHEWLIVGFAKGDHIMQVWMNKGEDNMSVSPAIAVEEIVEIGVQLDAAAILQIHNHPNPNPSRYTALMPSAQDQRAAHYYGERCAARGMNLLAFVAERGQFVEYACWVPDHIMPLVQFSSSIPNDGRMRIQNIGLRWELRRKNPTTLWADHPNASHNMA